VEISTSRLVEKVRLCKEIYKNCTLCPRSCGVDRTSGERGRCGSGAAARVASVNVHRDEEPPISGSGGSGTVFLSGCSLRCMFCQNLPLSRMGTGVDMEPGELGDRMVDLQRRGVHNINIVTGTHFIPSLLEALLAARGKGLNLPVVWNTGGYERVESLRLLEGVVDIYLADYKFSDSAASEAIASAPDYPETARRALGEMARQAGPLVTDDRGIARSGLIVRHLVLPGDLSGTEAVIAFVARELPRGTALSLMSQYTPYGEAAAHPLLRRRLLKKEYRAAVKLLERYGILDGWTQER
jgi:putative pyruvate formate lyase activating enzyme